MYACVTEFGVTHRARWLPEKLTKSIQVLVPLCVGVAFPAPPSTLGELWLHLACHLGTCSKGLN